MTRKTTRGTAGSPIVEEGAASVPRRPSTRLLPALLGAALCVLAAGALYALRAVGTDGVETITAGKVYQSGALGADDLRSAVRRLRIRTVIDLRTLDHDGAGIERESAILSGLGVDHINIPARQAPRDATVDRFLDVMSDPGRYPVLIHCKHGYGRSVLFSAIYRIEFEGWDNERARRATRNPLHLPWSSFDVEAPKGAYLRGYLPRRTDPLADGEPLG